MGYQTAATCVRYGTHVSGLFSDPPHPLYTRTAGKEINARRRKGDDASGMDIDVEAETVSSSSSSTPMGGADSSSSAGVTASATLAPPSNGGAKKDSRGKGEKFRAIKAREAAAKAASEVDGKA